MKIKACTQKIAIFHGIQKSSTINKLQPIARCIVTERTQVQHKSCKTILEEAERKL